MVVNAIAMPKAERGVFAFDFPSGSGDARCYLTSRALGSMTFDPGNVNRKTVFEGLEIPYERVAGTSLAHSRKVFFANAPADAAGGRGDGIIAASETIVPCVTVADCMPIWLSDGDTGLFGVLHSGWKGTGILAEGVAVMKARGARDVLVVLGPHIRSCCYGVDGERAEAFAREFGDGAVRSGPAGPALDLLAANIALAERAGVRALAWVDVCTSCDDRLGSFRREGAERFTRMAAFCVKGDPASFRPADEAPRGD